MLWLQGIIQGAQDIEVPDDAILDEGMVQEIGADQEYAGLTWEQYKARNPLYNILSDIPFEFLGNMLKTTTTILTASLSVTLREWKSPIQALKEDISTIFTGAGLALKATAFFAITWKLLVVGTTVWTAFKIYKSKRRG